MAILADSRTITGQLCRAAGITVEAAAAYRSTAVDDDRPVPRRDGHTIRHEGLVASAYSARSRHVLDMATKVAWSAGNWYLDDWHVFVGLLTVGGPVTELLNDHGITATNARTEVNRYLSGPLPGTPEWRRIVTGSLRHASFFPPCCPP